MVCKIFFKALTLKEKEVVLKLGLTDCILKDNKKSIRVDYKKSRDTIFCCSSPRLLQGRDPAEHDVDVLQAWVLVIYFSLIFLLLWLFHTLYYGKEEIAKE